MQLVARYRLLYSPFPASKAVAARQSHAGKGKY